MNNLAPKPNERADETTVFFEWAGPSAVSAEKKYQSMAVRAGGRMHAVVVADGEEYAVYARRRSMCGRWPLNGWVMNLGEGTPCTKCLGAIEKLKAEGGAVVNLDPKNSVTGGTPAGEPSTD